MNLRVARACVSIGEQIVSLVHDISCTKLTAEIRGMQKLLCTFSCLYVKSELCTAYMKKIAKQCHTDVKVLSLTGMTNINAMLCRSELRHASQVALTTDERFPHKIFNDNIDSGRRSRSGQEKPYIDSVKNSMKKCCIDNDNQEKIAADRSAWRSCFHVYVVTKK